MRKFSTTAIGLWLLYVCSTPLQGRDSGAVIQWRAGSSPHALKSATEATADLRALAARTDARHVVLQFSEPLTDNTRAQMAAAGVELLGYLGDNAFFASLHADSLNPEFVAKSSLGYASAIDEQMKLHPVFLNGNIPSHARVGTTAGGELMVAAYLIFHPDVDLIDGVNLMTQLGVDVRDAISAVNGLVIEFPQSLALKIAADDRVQWIEPPLPPFSEWNDSNRARTGASTAQAAPYSLSGAGVTVLVYDAGTGRATHQDFGGRLTVRDNSGLLAHSTHVAGTIGGSGAASGGTYKGMAPGVTLLSYGFQYDGTGIFLYSNPGDLNADYNQAINTFGAKISSNSIGSNVATNGFDCSFQGNYGVTDQLIDNIVRGSLGAPFRVVWAAGNERQSSRCQDETFCTGAPGGCGQYYSVPPPATAKNHITVGALNSNNDTMTSFSSWGPTDDGRMKPDVSGPGCQSDSDFGVTSCTSTSDTAYATMCGTSMACPTVAGCCALLMQDYRAHYGGVDPRNSTLKIFLAHNAVDLGNVGPDNQFGYGSVRIVPTIDFERLGNFAESQVSTSGTVPYTVNIPSGTPQLKVTLAWDDAAGTPNVNPALVNDLDLRVFDPNNVQRFPWTLNPSSPSAAAVQTQRNSRDNIEQVLVNNPIAGAWRIEVFGFNVPQGPQPFSICASPNLSANSGCTNPPPAPTGVTASDGGSCTAIAVSWGSSTGATSYNIWRNTVNNSGTASVVANAVSSPFNDATALAGTTYYYWVSALNGCGQSSLSAADSGFRDGVPTTPTSVSASDGTSCSTVSISWSASAGATGYSVLRNISNNLAGATLIGSPTGTSFTDTSVTPGATYFYWVNATNGCGTSGAAGPDTGFSNSAPPAAPTNIAASDGSSCTSVTISWTSPGNAIGYGVYRNTINDSASATVIGSPAATFFEDTTALPGVTYYYWVVAVNQCGVGPFSAPDTGFVGASGPQPPTNVAASDATSCSSVTVTWSASVGASSYTVWRNTTSDSAGASSLGSIAASPFTDATVAVGTTYYYWVSASNACGSSALAGPDTGSAGGAGPAAPTGVQASDGTSCTVVNVTWTAASGATGYNVRRNTIDDSASATLIGSPAGSPFTDSGAVAGTTYYYWVSAVNNCGEGPLSTSDSGFASNTGAAPPANVSASDGTSCTNVSVSWSASSGATGYQVWRNTTNNSSSATQIGSPATSPFVDSTAAAGVTYYYWVAASNACGTGALGGPDTGYRNAVQVLPPGTVAASDGSSCSAVTVDWTPSAGATGYQVWRNTVNNSGSATQIANVSAGPYDDTTAAPGTTYYYWVKATDACGASGFSSPDSGFRSVSAPAVPTQVRASNGAFCDHTEITWNAVSGATSYLIYRNTSNNSGTATLIGTSTTASFNDTSGVVGTKYFYFVRAANSCGTSGFSGGTRGWRSCP